MLGPPGDLGEQRTSRTFGCYGQQTETELKLNINMFYHTCAVKVATEHNPKIVLIQLTLTMLIPIPLLRWLPCPVHVWRTVEVRQEAHLRLLLLPSLHAILLLLFLWRRPSFLGSFSSPQLRLHRNSLRKASSGFAPSPAALPPQDRKCAVIRSDSFDGIQVNWGKDVVIPKSEVGADQMQARPTGKSTCHRPKPSITIIKSCCHGDPDAS